MGGSNNHPTPVEMKIRIRLLLMGASPSVAAGCRAKPSTSGASVAMEEEAPSYLSAGAIGITDEQPPAAAQGADTREIRRLLAKASEDSAAGTFRVSRGQAGNQEFSRAGLGYVAGYLARKCKAVAPNLTDADEAGHGAVTPALEWTRRRSRGGLTLPSAEWLELVEAFEVQFCLLNGTSDIDRQPGLLRRLIDHLQTKYPSVPKKVLKKYATTRVHLRIRWLNREYKAVRAAKREARRMKYMLKSAAVGRPQPAAPRSSPGGACVTGAPTAPTAGTSRRRAATERAARATRAAGTSCSPAADTAAPTRRAPSAPPRRAPSLTAPSAATTASGASSGAAARPSTASAGAACVTATRTVPTAATKRPRPDAP